MSRIGKKPITIPKNVTINLDGSCVIVEGPKGRLNFNLPPDVSIDKTDSELRLSCSSSSGVAKATFGLSRSLIYNMVKGVTEGFSKELEIVGVGFRAQLQGKTLNLNLGFSHPINFPVPDGITIEAPKPTQIIVRGIDKIKVGETAAKIRSFFPPEPYKGKGIRYAGELIRRKAGKAQVSSGAGGTK